MTKRIKPLAYDEDGYSFECKSCMARAIVDDATQSLDRTLRHLFRDAQALIQASDAPLALKIRKRAGLDLRQEKIIGSVNELLGAFYDVWAELEDHAEHAGDVAVEEQTKKNLKRLQDARHDENRQMVSDVVAWWHAHKAQPGMTKDKAASEIAGKVVPLKWRTVRDHLKGL